MTEIMGILTVCLALLAGAWLVLKGQTHLLGIPMAARPLDLGSLLLFYGFLFGTADPLRKLSDIFSRLQGGMAAADRIYGRLDRVPAVRNAAAPAACFRHRRELVLEGVDFHYHPGQPVLEDIQLRIPFGQAVAVVGPNGCGKSTLANLIPRFADPVRGVIRLDGVPLADIRLRDLRGQIGLVTQDPILFDDTVYNNIRYGRPQASRGEIIEAAKRAHAHRFIESELPQGYDTVVGALGGRLSGGQRQRIALARAILRDPAILILDEATSQIDLESEQAIQQALESFIRNRTTLIITHRLAVLSLADRIIVMQAGRIVDAGTHDELSARSGLYRRLQQLQAEDLRRSA
jgi:ATP-binding cassette subfamily B protein/subfamily B ATP-binding cassette protein MsbA